VKQRPEKLGELIAKAYEELGDENNGLDEKTADIYEALEGEARPVLERWRKRLLEILREVGGRQPSSVAIIAREFLAIGIWLGRRTKEMESEKPNGHPPA
jgi:hypothetical protein